MLRPFSPRTAMPSSSSFSPSSKPKRSHNSNSNSPSPNPNFTSMSPCNHSPSATLDLIILVLVLFSCAFLIISSFAHLARTLSLLLPPLLRPLAASFYAAPLPYLAALLLLLLAALIAAAELSCSTRSLWPFWPRRRCGNPRCRGLRKALEFDVQLQTEEALRSPPDDAAAAMWKEIDGLPWKGGQQGNNPDYECLRAELRRLAPPNGRAVLLFRSRCGCPIAKLEGWGPKRSRRNKK